MSASLTRMEARAADPAQNHVERFALSNPPGATRRFLRAGALPRTHFI